jgi:hypothetical protein
MIRLAPVVTLVLCSGLAICCAAENERICETPSIYPVDVDRKCLLEPVNADGLQACRSKTEKGQAFECVVSSDDGLYVAVRNAAAAFESSSWRYGDRLSSSEKEVCEQVLGPPYPGEMCE